jgi:hypothetical protein
MHISPLPFRQVHMDFHTSEAIPDIAASFNPKEFALTLARAHVNSVTCFARCHHGWMYYDSKLFPERIHPNLVNRNLLKEQIEACHALGIRVPIYITVQWDHYTATHHPEWCVLHADGSFAGTPPYEAGFYRYLCVHSPYRDYLKAHTKEVLNSMPVDGIFFDIVQPIECSCQCCREGMERQGLEPSDSSSRQSYALRELGIFKQEMTDFVRAINPDCTIFYNAGHVGPRHRLFNDAYTHYELESLPSGGWGYIHFPITARYARTLGKEIIGMTGKFHTSWGDFHSFKNLAALQYETFQMLALGAKCSIGDQLHPNGVLSQPVYDLIESVYAQVEVIESWCVQSQPVVDIGVFTPEEFLGAAIGNLPPAIIGVTRMLIEGGHQFDVIDSAGTFENYRLLILPDEITLNSDFVKKIQHYMKNGGSLLASYHSGLDTGQKAFNLPELGIELLDDAPFSPDFLLPHAEIGKNLPETELVMYLRALQVKPLPGTVVLADTIVPYFNRTYRHFCSHSHTPSAGEVGYPGILRRGNVIYFAHPIFTQYHHNAPRWVKILLLNAIDLLLPNPLLRHDGPSTLVTAVNRQHNPDRLIIHLLHYIPERRGQDFDVIEDVIPLHNLSLSLRTDSHVKDVRLVPSGASLPFKQQEERINFTVTEVIGYQVVEISLSEIS